MQTVNDLLDAAKQAQGLETDMALAKALGVGRAAVSAWRHGSRLPDPVACATLAGLTGEPLAKVLGIVGEARAVSREEKAVWRKLAATAMGVLLGIGLASPSDAHTATTGFQHGSDIHYAKFWLSRFQARLRWLWLWLTSCLPRNSPRKTELAA